MTIFLLIFLWPQILPARTPPLHEVQEQALREAGYDREELQDWKRKSRWSAALPRLQVGLDRDLKDIVKLTTRDNVSVSGGEILVGPDENNFDQDFQQGIGVEVKAVWYLNELLFNQDQLDASRERRNWLEDRMRLLERVTGLYFAWKKENQRGRQEELAGHLDSYTGGWFSAEVQKR